MIEYCINCGAGVQWGGVFSKNNVEKQGKKRKCPMCKEDFDYPIIIENNGTWRLANVMRPIPRR